MRLQSSWRRFLPVAVLLAATAVFFRARNLTETIPPHIGIDSFPEVVSVWKGRDVPMVANLLEVLGPGEFLMRDYQRLPNEPPVTLFLAYFPSQRTGDTIHSPQNCLPAAGWTPVESGRIPLRLKNGTTVSVNRYVIAKGLQRELVFYWYQAQGRVTPNEYWAKIFLVTDAIRTNRTDGALVRIVTPIEGKNDEAPAQVRALNFAEQILPILDGYIPR
jgi:EpsI family protein